MDTVRKQPTGGGSHAINSHCEFGSKISRTSGFRDAESARDALTQAGGSCGTNIVYDVKNEPVGVGNESREELPASAAVVNGTMVKRVLKARRRKFAARRVQESRGVRAWRLASPQVVTQLLAFAQCVSVLADVNLQGRSSLHVRSELRSRLAAALLRGDKEKAFAKECGFSEKPLANDPDAMMRAYPALQQINYQASPVHSGINVSLWKFWHARHCKRCKQDKIHDDCYFKPLCHFLRTGFELPVRRGFDIYAARPTRIAYVDKWREEEARCKVAFKKWKDDSSGLMSPVMSSAPKLVFPLLPVVRAKDAWRHAQSGEQYKVRLCVDFKNGGLNDMLEDWPFRYWGLESVAETVSQGDWLASIDISRFYLRLPAGAILRSVQGFQDPESFGVDTNANERISESARRYRQLRSVAFGLKPAPAYASAVSAEARRILESFGVSVAGVYIDDFLIRGATRVECEQALQKATAILTALGIPPNDKTQKPCSPAQGIKFLGVLIRTADCSMSVTEEHRQYSIARLQQVLEKGRVTLRELESIAGILSWVAHVFIPGRPRREALFAAISRLKGKGAVSVEVRGQLKRQLQWWLNAMGSKRIPASTHFWDKQPEVPLMCSDASGDDGWGACMMGLHIVGSWPDEWKQSAGRSAPSMLFKELVPIVISILLVARFCTGKVIAAATDNAGVAFVLNSLSCRCPWSLALLRPLCDALATYRLGLVAGHAHRQHNTHADELSHALSQESWDEIARQVPTARPGHLTFNFVVHDVRHKQAFAASMSFPLAITADASAAR